MEAKTKRDFKYQNCCISGGNFKPANQEYLGKKKTKKGTLISMGFFFPSYSLSATPSVDQLAFKATRPRSSLSSTPIVIVFHRRP